MYPSRNMSRDDELVTRFAPLVKRIAYHLISRLPASVLVDDLIQAGMIGLLDAARQYDEAQGASFETYASIRVRGAMLDELRRNNWAPKSIHRRARDVAAAIHQIEVAEGRDATDREIAEKLGITMEEYHQILMDTSTSQVANFEDLGIEEGNIADSRTVAESMPLRNVQNERFASSLADAIASLPEREKLILGLYYDEELNLKEIGKIINVSESRVSQILSQTYLRLRTRLGDWLQA